jgi:hypothetical protein
VGRALERDFFGGTPLMLIVPEALGWLDIVIGNPSGQHAFLLGYAGETLTSEIPYPLDADAMRRVDALLGAIQANASAAVAD